MEIAFPLVYRLNFIMDSSGMISNCILEKLYYPLSKILNITHTRPKHPEFEYSQPGTLVNVNFNQVNHMDETLHSCVEQMFLFNMRDVLLPSRF
jgi:hypothetical protein